MVYHLVRPVARYVLRYYYRNIDLTGLENIPPDAAVVLAANHPTAFIEPCILACFQPRTLWFLARGNLFKNVFYNNLLAAVHILPVFRLEDGGYGRLKDNFGTFEACFRALSQGKAIMNLAEGRCIHEKALRPLRKGTARLALGAMQRDATLKEVYSVPVGCNFTHPDRVRDPEFRQRLVGIAAFSKRKRDRGYKENCKAKSGLAPFAARCSVTTTTNAPLAAGRIHRSIETKTRRVLQSGSLRRGYRWYVYIVSITIDLPCVATKDLAGNRCSDGQLVRSPMGKPPGLVPAAKGRTDGGGGAGASNGRTRNPVSRLLINIQHPPENFKRSIDIALIRLVLKNKAVGVNTFVDQIRFHHFRVRFRCFSPEAELKLNPYIFNITDDLKNCLPD